VLDLVQKSIAAGKSRDAVTAITALPGFEDFQSVPPRGTLANVLGAAFDELSAK
jgi:hypothetical protein